MSEVPGYAATDPAAMAAVMINGVTIDPARIADEAQHYADADDPLEEARHGLAIRELLRQRAVELALVDASAAFDDAGVDALLAREVSVPKATREDCERYYMTHASKFRRNEIVYASHILFAVTEHSPLVLLRQKAEATLREVLASPERFETIAGEVSNCPSAGVGGSLGQLLRGDSVAEFDRTIFDTQESGVLPRLVNTRFGFHIVRIERRTPGDAMPFDEVEASIATYLDQCVERKALQQYIWILASDAKIEGIDLGAVNGPLVQ